MKNPVLLFCIIFFAHYIQAQGPNLIGMTSQGGVYGNSTIIQYTGSDTIVSKWTNLILEQPEYITLTQAPNGKFYGLTIGGSPLGSGPNYYSSIIEYDYVANTSSVMVNFDSAASNNPSGNITLANDGKLYGTTAYGGANGGGILFSYTPGGTSVTKLMDMDSFAYPFAPLIQSEDGLLYGSTWYNGGNQDGTIFSYNINTNVYSTLFTLQSGATIYGGLLEVGRDTFYGLSSFDGNYSGGTLFRYIASASTYDDLFDLDASANPGGSLIRATDGNLYGLTNSDGSGGLGTIFNYDIATATYLTLYNFGSATNDGTRPLGDLYQASDGKLYGMTNEGGLYGGGNIFQYNISTSTYASEVNLDSATGGGPYYGHFTEYVSPSGVVSVRDKEFGLYPNPTIGSFTITNNYPGALSVQIINLLGERLKTLTINDSQHSFDISDLAAGIYEVQISDENHTLQVMKVVKE